MTEQNANIKGEIHRLPVVGSTRDKTYVVVDNRIAQVRPGGYFAVHARTGQILPILNRINHTRRAYLAFAQEIEDLRVFDKLTGQPTKTDSIRARAVAIAKTWGT